jgi:arginine decarboxylase
MLTDQTRAPIVEALAEFKAQGAISFGVPGHKSGKAAPEDIKQLLGAKVFETDATTQKGIDDRRETKEILQQAEHLAAEAWGAAYSYLSTNGTSLSNHAAFFSVAEPGDTVLVARNAHKSVIAGLVIAKLRPVFLEPDHDEDWDVEHGVPAATLERTLAAHPEAKGVFIVSPSFYGVASDLRRLADICHEHGKPLVVDEAWGPHFAFSREMPPSAIACGADMALGSIHKTMAGLQGASIMLLNSRLIAPDRFALSYDLFESTSPPVQVLATTDATRRQFVQDGERLIGRTVACARRAREAIGAIEGLRVMGREVLTGDARFAMDDTKILLDVGDLGVTGYEAEDWLITNRNLSLGLSDDRHLLAIFTIGNDDATTDALIAGLQAMAEWARGKTTVRRRQPEGMPARKDLETEMAMTPAEAFFARTEHVPLGEAAGRIAAEMVAPYPPGMPRLLPGQRISRTHVAFLQLGMDAGMFSLGNSDTHLRTVRVVA